MRFFASVHAMHVNALLSLRLECRSRPFFELENENRTAENYDYAYIHQYIYIYFLMNFLAVVVDVCYYLTVSFDPGTRGKQLFTYTSGNITRRWISILYCNDYWIHIENHILWLEIVFQKHLVFDRFIQYHREYFGFGSAWLCFLLAVCVCVFHFFFLFIHFGMRVCINSICSSSWFLLVSGRHRAGAHTTLWVNASSFVRARHRHCHSRFPDSRLSSIFIFNSIHFISDFSTRCCFCWLVIPPSSFIWFDILFILQLY